MINYRRVIKLEKIVGEAALKAMREMPNGADPREMVAALTLLSAMNATAGDLVTSEEEIEEFAAGVAAMLMVETRRLLRREERKPVVAAMN